MLLPLAVLALLSVIGGWVGIPAALGGNNQIEHFLDPVFANGTSSEAIAATTGHGLELVLAFISVLMALAGFYIAYVFYYEKPGMAAALADRNQAAYNLVKNKYWVDELYGAFLITPLLMFTHVSELIVDRGLVDGSGAAAGAGTRGLAWLTRKQISGNIRSYAGWLAIGAAAVIAAMVFGNALWVHL
jgi:NADH-quinone oxidoreductase subunit L